MSSNNKLWLLLEVFFPITSNSWWFVTSYIILFLMIPVLNQIFVNVEGKFSFPFIVLFLFILYMTSVFDFKYQGIQNNILIPYKNPCELKYVEIKNNDGTISNSLILYEGYNH